MTLIWSMSYGDPLTDPIQHIEELSRIGRAASDKIRSVRIKIKTAEGKVERLKRVKLLKDGSFKRVYITM